ncbi:heterokaryon incompatibility protein-domain-containing protein [Echria macrotheca]|uniref:Heterokaryon incompatibility protein-domain-containing protein n=1 Tax=Echria macrotheca TaxID=438768 RepID=A0AAJ0F2Q7_9PEZI|nr:heterokaryon incompatibility protein-domain-containing protein [Echria macrotheca]
MDSYSYQELHSNNEIRLLQLSPDPAQPHGFTITLTTSALESAPPFCALSYTWQTPVISATPHDPDEDLPPNLVPVTCNNRSLLCTENAVGFLSYALHHRLFQPDIAYPSPFAIPKVFRLSPNQTTSVRDITPRHVWIDAICINQSDVPERSRQVSLMGAIYQRSTMTLIWLGQPEPPPAARWVLLTFIPLFLGLVERTGWEFLFPMDPECTDARMRELLGDDVCEKWRECYKHFFLFLAQRRWFSRGWVVQEVVLKSLHAAGDDVAVVCGAELVVPWKGLAAFLATLTRCDWRRTLCSRMRRDVVTAHTGYAVSALLQRVYGLLATESNLREFEEKRAEEGFYSLFLKITTRMRAWRFTDKRDVIYGSYGLMSKLVPDGEENPLAPPDYALGEVEVWTRAALAMLKGNRDLQLFESMEEDHERTTPNLPSWVPDFSVTAANRVALVRSTFHRDEVLFNASKWDPGKNGELQLILRDGGVLVLRGVRHSTVLSADVWLNNDRMEERPLEHLLDILGREELSLDGESAGQALSLTLTCGVIPYSIPHQTEGEEFCRWWTTRLVTRIQHLEEKEPGSSRVVLRSLGKLGRSETGGWLPTEEDVLAAMETPESQTVGVAAVSQVIHRLWARRRRFFLTTEGRMGIGPASMQPEDEVWILEGGRMPFILRRQNRDGSGLRLVGCAYVHGIMGGEAMTEEMVGRVGEVTLV